MDNITQKKLEKILGMEGGYVLDFSNSSFADFVSNCLSFDPYDRYEGSKANILRQIWSNESESDVARLNVDLLNLWRFNKESDNTPLTDFEATTSAALLEQFAKHPAPTPPEELEFLDRDLSQIDLTALPAEISAQTVLRARLQEIDRCLQVDAPLAVIFLAGSTLEGLLMEVARAKATEFIGCASAPQARGKEKPIDEWTLAELIVVSRELGILGEDVARFADHVRDFRNYIHPRQQLKSNFEPRVHTAQIAQRVLLAAIEDLKELADYG